MDRPQALQFAFPKPGRALTAVLVAVGVCGVFSALFATWVPGGEFVFGLLAFKPDRALVEPWRLLTSGLLTSPSHVSHLLFSLIGLYFLSAPLERRWGGARLLRLLGIAVVAGNLTMLAVGAIGSSAQDRFRPELAFGPAAAIAAIAVAWAREYPDSTVNLFFFLPIRGRSFLWITIGLCVLDLVYPAGMPEGVIAPFGGILAGLLLGGTPSPLRTAWLHARLALLRRRGSRLSAEDVLGPKRSARKRSSSTPLRVVPGGLDDVLKSRTPPKDKRFLN
jgi:membrane associated rhomboid family serine protease